MNSTLISPAKLSELKRLNLKIEALEEMQSTFGGITIEERINLHNYKQELSTLIKSL